MNNALGPLMLDVEGTFLSDFEKTLLQRPAVGGLILFSRNYQSPEQLLELTAAIREVRPKLLIAVDQEGGRVQRLKAGFLKLPALRLIGELYEQSQEKRDN
jgi:beta-N-acetylhexosaminidase